MDASLNRCPYLTENINNLDQYSGGNMSKRKLTVKVSTIKEAINEFKDTWKQHAQGKKLNTPIETLRFENSFTFMKTLIPS